MKIDKRVILYHDHQLKDVETVLFEAELKSSPELSEQLQHYKRMLHLIRIDEQKLGNEQYFVNLVPKFKQSITSGNRQLNFRTAYTFAGLVIAIMVAFAIYNPFRLSDNNTLDKLISTVGENEAKQIYDFYSDNFQSSSLVQENGTSESILTDMISSELNLQEADLNQLVQTERIKIDNIYSLLQEDEANLIYNEILNKKYF